MSQEDLISAIVREILVEMNSGKSSVSRPANSGGLDPSKDYPLAEKRPDLVKTSSGKSLNDITLDGVVAGKISPDDLRITADVLELQAQVAEKAYRPQVARNMRRAAELTQVADERILEIYNALRPYRSTKAELLAIADELEGKYKAHVCAAFVREAADVYDRRGRLKT